MSDRITADLDPRHFGEGDSGRLLYHAGGASAPLARWRQLLRAASPRGWGGVRALAGDVMRLVADPRVLHEAAVRLRAGGPKAPGPNGLPLEALDGDELWGLCTALGGAVRADAYRPGGERVEWVPKAAGGGKRPVVLIDAQDRVVQKAASLVLRPMLDPLFDPLSFAFRPRRTREQAVAVAGQLALNGHPVWLTHDLRDAFGRVPVPRLLDVVHSLLPCPRLRGFLGRVLPPRSRGLGGLKQGGPLSPLALEVYLSHFLDAPWRKAGHPVRLVRYADDLLLTAADAGAARAADAALRALLTPAGMLLKATFEEAAHDLREKPAGWLGLQFRLAGPEFQIRLGGQVFAKLGRRFLLAHAKCRPARRAARVLEHWAGQLGPCYRWEDRDAVCRRAGAAAAHGFEEAPPAEMLADLWEEAYGRWGRARRRVRRTPGYLVTGPVAPPTPTSVVW